MRHWTTLTANHDGVPAGHRSGSRSVLRLAGSYYLALTLGVITGPLAARRLGPVGEGQVESIILYVAFVSLIFTMGMTASVSHAVAAQGKSPQLVLGAVIRYCLWLIIPTAALPLILLVPPWDGFPRAVTVVALLILLVMPGRVLGTSLEGMLLGRGDLRALATLRSVAALVTATLTLLLFATHLLTVATDLAITAGTGLVTVLVAFRLVGTRPCRGGRPMPLLRFGARGVAAHVSSFANARMDELIVLAVLGAGALGQYFTAVLISLVPVSLAQAIGAHSFTRVGRDGTFDPPTAAALLRKSALISIAVCSAIAATAHVVVPLVYGDAFRPSITPLLVLLPGTVCLSMNEITYASVVYIGRPGLLNLGELVGLVTTLGGLFLVLRPYGIVGAAAVSSLAYAVRLAVTLVILRKYGVRRLRPGMADVGELVRAVRGLLDRSPPS